MSLPAQAISGTPAFGWAIGVVVVLIVLRELTGLRYIANNRVGIVEKLWSFRGSVGDGRFIARAGEAGYQAEVLRGGVRFGLWRCQYRVPKVALVSIPQGKIGYLYARDGEPPEPSQMLGREVACSNFQDTRAFLVGEPTSPGGEAGPRLGQRGRQRPILREGLYAVNLAQFVVIAEHTVDRLDLQGGRQLQTLVSWRTELGAVGGFDPVVIGAPIEAPDPVHPERRIVVDSIGIVTMKDGPSLAPGEIIAPSVRTDRDAKSFHDNFQVPEAFLRSADGGVGGMSP